MDIKKDLYFFSFVYAMFFTYPCRGTHILMGLEGLFIIFSKLFSPRWYYFKKCIIHLLCIQFA